MKLIELCGTLINWEGFQLRTFIFIVNKLDFQIMMHTFVNPFSLSKYMRDIKHIRDA